MQAHHKLRPTPKDGKKGRKKGSRILIDYAQVESLAGRGLSKEHIALCLGISNRTLSDHIAVDKKMDEAMQRGAARAIAAVTGKLFKSIDAMNMTAIIFYLKCQAGWRETSVIETRDLNKPIPDEMNLKDASELYKNKVKHV